jgi:hypothetical protein
VDLRTRGLVIGARRSRTHSGQVHPSTLAGEEGLQAIGPITNFRRAPLEYLTDPDQSTTIVVMTDFSGAGMVS